MVHLSAGLHVVVDYLVQLVGLLAPVSVSVQVISRIDLPFGILLGDAAIRKSPRVSKAAHQEVVREHSE